jgi:hypothetical protein
MLFTWAEFLAAMIAALLIELVKALAHWLPVIPDWTNLPFLV